MILASYSRSSGVMNRSAFTRSACGSTGTLPHWPWRPRCNSRNPVSAGFSVPDAQVRCCSCVWYSASQSRLSVAAARNSSKGARGARQRRLPSPWRAARPPGRGQSAPRASGRGSMPAANSRAAGAAAASAPAPDFRSIESDCPSASTSRARCPRRLPAGCDDRRSRTWPSSSRNSRSSLRSLVKTPPHPDAGGWRRPTSGRISQSRSRRPPMAVQVASSTSSRRRRGPAWARAGGREVGRASGRSRWPRRHQFQVDARRLVHQ